MKRGFLLVLLISFTAAQLIRRKIKLINVKSFDDLKAKVNEAGEKLVIIGFLPRACPHSRRLIPQVEKLAHHYADLAVFLRVFEGHDDIFDEFHVRAVPTFIYMKKSKLLKRRTGSNINDLVNVLEAATVEDHVLNTVNSQYPEEEGQLYEVECYDDFKGRLAEAKDKLVVIAFMPNHCGISYAMVPEVQRLAKKYKSTTSFIRVNEDHDDIYEVFAIQIVPTFIFMQDKKKLFVRTGGGIKELRATLEAVLTGDYTSTTTTTQKPTSHIINVGSPEDMKQKVADAGNKLVVAVFMTHSCPKCQMVDAMVENMANEYYDSVVFLKVVDDGSNEKIFKEFGILRVPTFVFMKNSKKINQYEGITLEKVKTRIELREFL